MAIGANERRIIELMVKATGTAEVRKMASELKQLRTTAQASQRSLADMSGGMSTLLNFAKGFVGAFSVQTIISWTRAILDAADALDAAAEQAGIGVERYQTLKEAFRSLEVDAKKFETGMERLAATMSQVLAGDTNTATKALDELGVSAKILSGEVSTTDELVDALANSQQALANDVKFTAAMVDLFGRKLGVDYANALKSGNLAQAEMIASMAEFGVVTEQEMATLAAASETVEQFQTRAGNAIMIWAAQAIDAFHRAGQAWDDYVRRRAQGAGILESVQGAAYDSAKRTKDEVRQAEIDAATGGQAALDRLMRGFAPAPARPPARARAGGGGAGGKSEAQRAAEEAAKRQAQINQQLLDQTLELVEAWAKEAEAAREVARELNAAVDPMLRYEEGVKRVNAAQASGILTDKARREELERLANEMLEAAGIAEGWEEAEQKRQEAQERQRQEMEKVRQEWGFIADAMGQATYDIISGSEKISHAIKRMVASIIADLIRVQAMKFIIGLLTGSSNPFAQRVGGFLGSASGNAFSSGGVVSVPTVHAMANGGIGVMGEAGPEAVLPLQRNAQGKLGVAAPGMGVTVNNYAGAEIGVRQTERGIQIDVIRRQLADDVRRGGTAFSAALEQTYRVGRQASAS